MTGANNRTQISCMLQRQSTHTDTQTHTHTDTHTHTQCSFYATIHNTNNAKTKFPTFWFFFFFFEKKHCSVFLKAWCGARDWQNGKSCPELWHKDRQVLVVFLFYRRPSKTKCDELKMSDAETSAQNSHVTYTSRVTQRSQETDLRHIKLARPQRYIFTSSSTKSQPKSKLLFGWLF